MAQRNDAQLATRLREIEKHLYVVTIAGKMGGGVMHTHVSNLCTKMKGRTVERTKIKKWDSLYVQLEFTKGKDFTEESGQVYFNNH